MRNRYLLGLGALTAVGLALRFATIDVQSYWFDEALTVVLLRKGLGEMLHLLPTTELTPPLYYVVGWLWSHIFGTGNLGLRSLSALLGAACVPVAYAATRELGSERAALTAAALTAFNPMLVWYSQEARPSALFVLLGALSVWLFLRAWREPSARRVAFWGVVSALALLTHYFAAFLILPEAVWLALVGPGRRAVIGMGAALGALGLGLIPLAARQAQEIPTGYITLQPVPRRLAWLAEDFLSGIVTTADGRVELVLTAISAPLLALGIGLALREASPERRRLLLVVGGVGVAAIAVPLFLTLGGLDYLNSRNLVVAVIPLLIVAAVGLAGRTGTALGPLAVGVLCAVGVAATVASATDVDLQRDDWRGAARAVGPVGGHA